MKTFKDLGLNPMILQALEEIGFEKPTPVQGKTIPHLINSERDLIALAQTGTGKTAAFSLPIIQRLCSIENSEDLKLGRHVRALILCPTRELAIQVAEEIKSFLKYLKDFRVDAVYGGERIDRQIRALKSNPQIVVGTPGRVNDLIRRRVLKVDRLDFLVLDEADEMLNMGFKEELDETLETTPDSKQVLLFSATMNQSIRKIASNYMKKPEEITIGNKNEGADTVEHFYYVVHERDRYDALRRIVDSNPDIHGIVFCRTRRETQYVADKLIENHYSAEALHGGIDQSERTAVMNRFRDRKIQLLVATDVAARGIDVTGLSHVLNYNLPESLEAYVHRSGRTGRAHEEGISLVIVNMREQHKIRHLERKIGKDFEKAKIPTGSDICEKQLFSLIDRMCEVKVNEKQIAKYLDVIFKKFENLSREELIKKFVSTEFNQFLEYYRDATDLNSPKEQKKKTFNNREKSSDTKFTKLKLNAGKKSRVTVKDIFRLFNSRRELKGVEIGHIDIQFTHTTVEIDAKLHKKVLSSLRGATLRGVKLRVN